MNIFGVGGWELAAILIIALIVAGPQRMARWAYIVGQYMGQLRIMWSQMMASIQTEFDDAGVDVKLPKNLPTRSDINRLAGDMLEPLNKQMKSAMNEVNQEADKVKQATSFKLTDDTTTPKKPSENGKTQSSPNQTGQDGFGTWSGTGSTDE
ncbi:MAG: hypothetical protein RLP44_25730 [Aggregatilineales bacterium]